MKDILEKAASLFNIPFLQISHKQPPFHSKVCNLTVGRRINIPDNRIGVFKFPLKEIIRQQKITTLIPGIPSFQLLQSHYHQLSFTGTYDPNPQAQNLNVFLENKTKDLITIPKSILKYIDFPVECNDTQPQPQPYTAFNLNKVPQTLVYHVYPDTSQVHNDYAPTTTQFDISSVFELNQVSIKTSSTVTTLI